MKEILKENDESILEKLKNRAKQEIEKREKEREKSQGSNEIKIMKVIIMKKLLL